MTYYTIDRAVEEERYYVRLDAQHDLNARPIRFTSIYDRRVLVRQTPYTLVFCANRHRKEISSVEFLYGYRSEEQGGAMITFDELVRLIGELLPPGCEVEFNIRKNEDGGLDHSLDLYDWVNELQYFGKVTADGVESDVRAMIADRKTHTESST